jgi:hypothetical protein
MSNRSNHCRPSACRMARASANVSRRLLPSGSTYQTSRLGSTAALFPSTFDIGSGSHIPAVDCGIRTLPNRIVHWNGTKVDSKIEGKRERSTSHAFCDIAVKQLKVHDVNLPGQTSPSGFRTELRELLAPQQRRNLILDLSCDGSAIDSSLQVQQNNSRSPRRPYAIC